MRPGLCNRVRRRVPAVSAWPVWENPRWLVAFIVAVLTAYVLAIGATVRAPSIPARDLLVLVFLLVCIGATVELTKRAGENAGLIKDVYAVWELPIALLLPPVYALLVPIFRLGLVQWRIRRIPLHRRVFTAAIVGLSYGSASLAFHGLTGTPFESAISPGAHGSVRVRDLVLGREAVQNDTAELCVAVLVTFGIAFTPLTIVFALPFVTLLQRSLRHAQLLNASRIDSKTGLLNAGTWEREAASEVARAVRTRTPLALMLIDLDHFKAVNDAHGHLAGDKALRAISRTFKIFLRDYDLAGRFGGEEFALLLPQTGEADAHRIAERMRVHIADMPIAAGDDPEAESIRVTVSIGVAALGTMWDRTTGSQLTDLLAAADTALYRAKSDGRDKVCMITDSETIAAPAENGWLFSS